MLIANECALCAAPNGLHYGAAFNYIVTAIAKNANNPNELALFDLSFDPAGYLDANDDDLRAAIDGQTKVVRRVSINAQPGLLPIGFAPETSLS